MYNGTESIRDNYTPHCIFRQIDSPDPSYSNLTKKLDNLHIDSSNDDLNKKKSKIAYYFIQANSKIKLDTFPFSVGYGNTLNLNLAAQSNTYDSNLKDTELFRLYINANYTLDLITVIPPLLVNGLEVDRCITLVKGDIISIPYSEISLKLHLEYELADKSIESHLIKTPIYSEEPGVALVYVFSLFNSRCNTARLRRISTNSSIQNITPRVEYDRGQSFESPRGQSYLYNSCNGSLKEIASLSLPGSPAINIKTSNSGAVLSEISPLGSRHSEYSSYYRNFNSTPSPTHILWSAYVRDNIQEAEEKLITPCESVATDRLNIEYFTCISISSSETLHNFKKELDKELGLMGIDKSYSIYTQLDSHNVDNTLNNKWVFQLSYLNIDSENSAPMKALRLAKIKPLLHARLIYINFL